MKHEESRSLPEAAASNLLEVANLRKLSRRKFVSRTPGTALNASLLALHPSLVPKSDTNNETSVRPTNVERRARMRALLRPDDLTDKSLQHVNLLGVDELRLFLPDVPEYRRDNYVRLENLLEVKKRVEDHGLRITTCYQFNWCPFT